MIPTPAHRYASAALLAVGIPLSLAVAALEPIPALSLRMALVAAGVLGVVGGIAWNRPARTRPWWLLVAALTSSLTGDAVTLDTLLRGELTGTVPADAWLTAAAGVLLVASVIDATGSTRRTDIGGLLDAMAVALAAGTLAWSVLVVPAAAPGWIGSSVETAGSIQILLFAALIALVLRAYGRLAPGKRLAVGLMVTALLCATAAFVLGALTDAGSAVPYTGPRAVLGALANLSIGAAALHPSMRNFTDLHPTVPEPLTGTRTLRLGIALYAPVGVLVWSLLTDTPMSIMVLAGAWVLLVPTVLARLYLLGRGQAAAQRRSDATERRLAALVAHTGDVLLLVRTGDDGPTIEYASPASRALLDRDPESLIGATVRSLVTDEACDTVADLLATAHTRLATADVQAMGPGGGIRWVQIIAERYAGDEEPDALVVTVRDVTERKLEEQRWVEAALRDPGTGLANRRAIEEHLQTTIATARPGTGSLGLLMCDLDDFKAINDAHGHAVGDAALREVADRLRGAVRRHDLVGRLGGDEFVVVCSLEDGVEALDQLAARIVGDVGRPFVVGDRELTLGCSVGATMIDDGAHSATDLLDRADRALYRAKHAGKGRVAWVGDTRTDGTPGRPPDAPGVAQRVGQAVTPP